MLLYRFFLGILLAGMMAIGGYKKNSLDFSGAVAAFIVGLLTTLAGVRYSLVVILFFVSSSLLTRMGSRRKAAVEGPQFKKGGQRNWVQVCCNSLPGLAACTAACLLEPLGVHHERVSLDLSSAPFPSLLALAFIGHFACCTGDTWASELGVLSKGSPRLVTQPWRAVPPGTNGGMSLVGTLASLLGGLFIGLCFVFLQCVVDGARSDEIVSLSSQHPSSELSSWHVLLAGMLGGLLGSLIDSLLGATLQYSGYCERQNCVVEHPGPSVKHITGFGLLDNHQVNLLSSFLTSLLIPIIAYLTF